MADSYKEYKELAFRRRGLILNEFSHLERLIDLYMAYHFCGVTEKAKELMNKVLSTKYIYFEAKLQILKWIDPKLTKQTNDILNNVIPNRNIFAHHLLDTTKRKKGNQKQTETHLLKYSGDQYDQVYTDKEINALHSLINKYIELFTQLTRKMETLPTSD